MEIKLFISSSSTSNTLTGLLPKFII